MCKNDIESLLGGYAMIYKENFNAKLQMCIKILQFINIKCLQVTVCKYLCAYIHRVTVVIALKEKKKGLVNVSRKEKLLQRIYSLFEFKWIFSILPLPSSDGWVTLSYDHRNVLAPQHHFKLLGLGVFCWFWFVRLSLLQILQGCIHLAGLHSHTCLSSIKAAHLF